MALPRTIVKLPFNGLNTVVDPKTADAGTYQEINNMLMTRSTELVKRTGVDLISNDTDTVKQAYSLNTEQGIITTDSLVAYDATANALFTKSTTISPSVNASPIIANTYTQSFPDYAVSDTGNYATIWRESTGAIVCSIQSSYNGGFIVSNHTLAASGTMPRVAGAVNKLVFFWVTAPSATHLNAISFNTTTGAFQSSPTVVESDLSTTGVYDVSKFGRNILIVAGSNHTPPANNIYGYVWNTVTDAPGDSTYGVPFSRSLGLVHTTSHLIDISIAVDPMSQYFTVAYIGDSNTVWGGTFNSYLIAVVSEYTIDATSTDDKLVLSSCLNTTNQLYVFYSTYNSHNTTYRVLMSTVTTSPTQSATAFLYYYLYLVSKAWYYNGNAYVILYYPSTSGLQNTYFIVTYNGDVAARLFTTNGGDNATSPSHPATGVVPNPNNLDQYSTALLRATKYLSQANGTNFITSSIYNSTFDYTFQLNSAPTQMNNTLNMVGGYLRQYDGSSVYEHGFHLYPEAPAASQTTGGSLTVGGTYSYIICWEWVDNAGLLHRSAPSVPTTVTMTSSNNKNTITVRPLPITNKATFYSNTNTPVVMAVYRTVSTGTVYYRLNPLQANFVYNNPAAATSLSYVDSAADSAIIANPELYTTGGIFPNIATPSANLCIVSKNRVWLADCDLNQNQVYPSKQIQPGLAAEFSNETSQFIDPNGGKITALASMDDTILFFKHSVIYYIGGEGPDQTGQNGVFTVPILISSDVGCPYPNSVILTKKGVMFQSSKGIYMVDRQLSVSWIGAPVQSLTNVAGTFVTSAVTNPDSNLVYFSLNTGQVLVYNTFFEIWFTQNYPVTIQAMTWSPSGFLFAGTNSLYIQNNSSYADGTSFIPSTLSTTWIQLNQLEGFGRLYNIYLAGDNVTLQDRLVVALYYDFEENPRQIVSIVPSSLNGSAYGVDSPYGSGSPYGGFYDGTFQFQIRPITQKCSCVRIEIYDQQYNSILSQSFKLSGVTLEIGLKNTGNKNLSPNRRLR